jgi:hypothetical protein
MYPFYTPRMQGGATASGTSAHQTTAEKQKDIDLLKEYGLDFNTNSSASWLHGSNNPFNALSNSAPQTQGQWATFE